MLKSTIALIVVAACAAPTPGISPPPSPDDRPSEVTEEDQHFCCGSVDPSTMSGEDCIPIGPSHVGGCGKVLYCSDSYTNDEGTVTCAT
ncbi:hypothetical protein ENSA5_00240 [Enhygromyxa salina]|uniref:Uncharacterized protein n=1 Tax=Enhygromyxa salina TaxID=215803 RepID=A0A2S9YLG9_9BACT|nr:hypothetical protein [Enhygromyxa salina]PRQ05912.1 hypothetical protein ENSA5_00240 [Enhygromyxa salina]